MISASPEIVLATVHRDATTTAGSEIMKGRAFYHVPAVIAPYDISYDSYLHRFNLSPARLPVSVLGNFHEAFRMLLRVYPKLVNVEAGYGFRSFENTDHSELVQDRGSVCFGIIQRRCNHIT